MAANDKDTIYIDIDDEITGIIDKVKASSGKVVALVLPKRATVFQSIVNMKLLKRAADSSKKNLVLITAEAGLLPLAGAAGIHVAKTLTSKPEIPVGPAAIDDNAEEAIQEDGEAVDPQLDKTKTLGQLASTGAASSAADGVETVDLDNEDLPGEAAKSAGAKAAAAGKTKKPKGKKLSIPNFERFRLWLIIGGVALVLLLIGLLVATLALPKATIAIKTDATTVDSDLDLNLSTAAKTTDPASGTIPTKLDQQQKTYTQQVPTTGQKNNGNKASGSVTLVNCSPSDDITLPAGTGLTSGGNTYITQQQVSIPASNIKKGVCQKDESATVNITAQSPGTAYNGANAFTVPGHGEVSGSASSQISGGTDNIVQSINQNDINNARSKIAAAGDAEMKAALSSQLTKEKYYPITATYAAGAPNVTASGKVGEVANTVTVTETITYTMFGVHKDDLKTLIKANVADQIDIDKQTILDYGIDPAVYNVTGMSATAAQVSMSTKVTAGPDLNVNEIKKNAAGKRAGAIKEELSGNPDVTDVNVSISPFWVNTAPKKTDRIKVEIVKPSSSKASSSNDNP